MIEIIFFILLNIMCLVFYYHRLKTSYEVTKSQLEREMDIWEGLDKLLDLTNNLADRLLKLEDKGNKDD